jgi:hypothetical protein
MIAAICFIGALITVLVLAAPSAEAACAWVLWVQAAPQDRSGAIVGAWTSWVVHGATTSADGCDSLYPNDREANKWALEATGIRLAADQNARLAWQCLPDTIDPRGAKGVGR